ncbi:MAG: DUF5655 domain-containing protein [Bacteroidia bacterium]
MKEKFTCPQCKRVLRSLNSYHYCKEVAIDDLFLNKSDEIVLIFDKLLAYLSSFENIEISATKNCIVFVRNKTFLVAKPMTKCLEIKFYANEPIDDNELYKCHLWSSKYEAILRLQTVNEFKEKHFQYFNNSYQIS